MEELSGKLTKCKAYGIAGIDDGKICIKVGHWWQIVVGKSKTKRQEEVGRKMQAEADAAEQIAELDRHLKVSWDPVVHELIYLYSAVPLS